jgi:putative DNA primase/helicase
VARQATRTGGGSRNNDDNVIALSIYHQQFQRYVDANYQPRPVEPGTKKCPIKGWSADVPTVSVPPGPNYGLGLRLGTKLADGTCLVAVDADRDEFVPIACALVPSPCGRIGANGIALFARVTQEQAAGFVLKLAAGGKAGEFLGRAAHCVIPPTIHPDINQPYYWTDQPLLELDPLELPLADPDFIAAVFASEHLPVLMGGTETHDALLRFIGELANLSDDYDQIERVIRACFTSDYDGDSLKELPRMIRDTANKFASGKWTKAGATAAGGAPPFSEEHLALEFAARHGDDLRYAKGLDWLIWTGTHWQPDDRRTAFSHARAVCREFARVAGKRLGRTVASAKTRAALVSLAQDDERIAASADQWDSDPWLLNTPGGTVELKSGRLRPHARDDYITKITAVAPDKGCPTPLWSAFLACVTAGEKELETFLQRACGYSLTGQTVEHALFFLYGTGANGKSTFVETMRGVMDDYARPVPMETLMWSRNERHPTDIAGLRGARVASAIETGKGRGWDEPKIMQLTGGDTISVRLMRQDFFDMTPQFKLWVAGNHKPGLRSVNEAIRRRVNLIPFTVTIPAEERDRQLGEKLTAEWPGILQWMVDGCLHWQAQGLAAPAAVTAATDDYLESQDLIAQFLEDSCLIDDRFEEQSSQLFSNWHGWCEARGEKPGHQRSFCDELEQKGFKRYRDKRGVWFRGLKLGTKDDSREQPPEH